MRPGYSEGVRRVLSHAQAAAGRDGHRFVHTEYLLISLLQERNSATGILKGLGFDRRTLLRECEAQCHRGKNGKEPGLRLTTRAQEAMTLAEQEAAAQQEAKVDTSHILIGLLLETEGKAGSVLRAAGVSVEAIRAALVKKETAEEPSDLQPQQRQKESTSPPARKPLWKLLLRV